MLSADDGMQEVFMVSAVTEYHADLYLLFYGTIEEKSIYALLVFRLRESILMQR